ncbi:MAG: prepilin-type N-terminal cleavage/methylation domain-containing protein [Candidatus Eremiobacteraeota bacterium]|nr:prepilin-type N-terminal cleavage/methylation domain-containing protein [Candidatus Eremiobacteraeota bacterium]MCW5869552.1 prepilin-type N-terminal cleavage/methylation domain-containing protein [Candidatus Eremiobacteraeota bacterium]
MQRRGFTLLELSLASTLVAVVLTVASVLLYYGMRNWRQLDQTQDASFQLSKACRHLREELRQTSFNECRIDHHGEMGDVVTFLSALDESGGEVLFQPDGSPFWQRNVMYYLIQPPGDTCQVADCSHKRLLRLSLDTGKATNADSDPAVSQEDLLAEPLDKLRADAPVVAVNLKSLTIQLAPDPVAFPDEVKVEVVGERGAQMQFSVFPRNVQ